MNMLLKKLVQIVERVFEGTNFYFEVVDAVS
jgi:hypothetical protein